MTARLLVTAAMLAVPLAAMAEQPGDGEKIFKAKCSGCHSLTMVQGLLAPKPETQRPAHLTKFLKTHPAKLDDTEKATVMDFLSRAAK